MAYSIHDVAATAAQTAFAVPFPYLSQADVFVFVDNEPLDGDFTFTGASTIDVTPDVPFAGGEVVRVRRLTPIDELITLAVGRGFVKSGDWNLVNTQLLYAIQEALDAANNAEAIAAELIDVLARMLAILASLQYTYDIAFAGYDIFRMNERLGPVPVTIDCTLPGGLTNSKFKVFTNPDNEHVFSVRKNNTEIGTVHVSTSGVVTHNINSDVLLSIGDSLSLVTTTVGGLTEFGATFAARRTL